MGDWRVERPSGRFETDWRLLWPPLVTAALVVVTGLLAGAPFSPLDWARFIAAREYRP